MSNLTTVVNNIISKVNTHTTAMVGFKNYIINGNFDVWQYKDAGLTYPQTSSGYGSDDRWHNQNVGSTKTHSKIACTDTERALFNASYFSRTVVTSVAGASNYCDKFQHIENVTRLAGKTVTLSFWAKADSAKKMSFNLAQIFGTGGSSASFGNAITINLTTTWQKFTQTFTVPSVAGKTLGADFQNASTTILSFQFDAGSTATSTYFPGSTVGQQSGTFDIAQVQLEEGSVATPFEQRPVSLELSLCQRYYEISGTSIIVPTASGFQSGTYVRSSALWSVKKRTSPTVVIIGTPALVLVSTPTVSTSDNIGATIQAVWNNSPGSIIGFACSITASSEL